MKPSTMPTSSKAGARTQATTPPGDSSNELRDYRIHERLGQDDLSYIYRATHQTFDQTYYVHLLRHGRQDWISVSRFNLIARLGKRLSHPNLLRIEDAGHDERFGHFYATLALDARRLSDVLAEGALTPVLALKVAGQVAEVIDYLHREQVIHRDVQPTNILLTPEGRAFLSNLSFAASSETPDLSSIDEADYLTPYSAPEQRLDNVAAVPALDVYSFGATLFHMLSGQIPPAPGETIPSVASDDPALSSADRVLRRMLDAEPEARFPSAGAAVSALRQSLRSLIDLSTEDMEESRWEARAEWLENPLETVLSGDLDDAFQDFYVARISAQTNCIGRTPFAACCRAGAATAFSGDQRSARFLNPSGLGATTSTFTICARSTRRAASLQRGCVRPKTPINARLRSRQMSGMSMCQRPPIILLMGRRRNWCCRIPRAGSLAPTVAAAPRFHAVSARAKVPSSAYVRCATRTVLRVRRRSPAPAPPVVATARAAARAAKAAAIWSKSTSSVGRAAPSSGRIPTISTICRCWRFSRRPSNYIPRGSTPTRRAGIASHRSPSCCAPRSLRGRTIPAGFPQS
ncbi:serine/threonine protein kinase [Candidatus Gracilibacteria bacterium]|nr:serine/threonine protein kinase [Candidatus Gracilibacteria bacterium]